MMCAALAAIASTASGAPVVGTLVVTPASVPVGATVQITAAVTITDTSLLQGGVNLLQVGVNGEYISTLGVLHDDGISGDQLPGDHVFTIRSSVPNDTPGTIYLRITAAFRGTVLRTVSNIVPVLITSPTPVSDNVAGIQLSIPTLDAPAQTALVQRSGAAPSLDIQYWDAARQTFATAFTVAKIGNNAGLTLLAWFAKYVDPSGVLLAAATFVPVALPDNSQALIRVGPLPPTYAGGPVEFGYVMTAARDKVAIVDGSMASPLPAAGLTAADIEGLAEQIVRSLKIL